MPDILKVRVYNKNGGNRKQIKKKKTERGGGGLNTPFCVCFSLKRIRFETKVTHQVMSRQLWISRVISRRAAHAGRAADLFAPFFLFF